jgi:hypothetical protein
MNGAQGVNVTETLLLSLDRETAPKRLELRRAYLDGSIIRSDLIRCSRPVRIIDYSETFHDGCFEIAVAVAAAPGEAPAQGLSR